MLDVSLSLLLLAAGPLHVVSTTGGASTISARVAQEASPSPRSMIRVSTADKSRAPAKIEDLAWLEGSWVGDMPDGPVEHVILPARHGHMPSFVRALAKDKVFFYEISVFAESGSTVVSRVKHFTPELSGWESREGYVERVLVERDEKTLFFDGLTILSTGKDSFTVYFLVKREDGTEGPTLVIPFRRSG